MASQRGSGCAVGGFAGGTQSRPIGEGREVVVSVSSDVVNIASG